MQPSHRICQRFLSLLMVLLALAGGNSAANADFAASHASALSLEASVEVPLAALDLLAAGGKFSVTAVRPVGQSLELVIESGIEGASFVLSLAADAVAVGAISVGSAVVVTSVSAGYVLSVAGAAIAFVPSQLASELIHHEVLRP